MSILVLLAAVASACSIEDSTPIPDCFRGESALIVAQSVPTGDLVPCFTSLPAGWEADSVKINQNGSVIHFDSDRAGDSAAQFRYEKDCDLGEAVSVPSDQQLADRYEYIERVDPGFRANRYYTFEGGCVWWVFDFDNDATASLSVELGNSLTFVTRQWLNENIRDSFIDEEL